MNIVHRVLWILALGMLLAVVGCAMDSRPPITDSGSPRLQYDRLGESIAMYKIEGHHYIIHFGSGMVHSASCSHPVHKDMREIY